MPYLPTTYVFRAELTPKATSNIALSACILHALLAHDAFASTIFSFYFFQVNGGVDTLGSHHITVSTVVGTPTTMLVRVCWGWGPPLRTDHVSEQLQTAGLVYLVFVEDVCVDLGKIEKVREEASIPFLGL